MTTTTLEKKLSELIPQVESVRGFALWTRAPGALTDAVQSALDSLNAALEIAVAEIGKPLTTENLTMKELFEMLEKFNAARDAVKGTSERLDKINDSCAKINDGLDAFFAVASEVEAATVEGLPDEPAPVVENAETVEQSTGVV